MGLDHSQAHRATVPEVAPGKRRDRTTPSHEQSEAGIIRERRM
jgi:hypothetical protein